MSFKIGQDYFYYTQNLGVLRMEYYHTTGKYHYFMVDGEPKEFHESFHDLIFESEDLAKIKFYKTKTKLTHDSINHHKDKVNIYYNMLNDLEERVQDLKDKYPEEFI